MSTPTAHDPHFSRAPSPELPTCLNIVLQPPNSIVRQALTNTAPPNVNIPPDVKNWVVDLITNMVEQMRQQTVVHYEHLINQQASIAQQNTTEFHNRTLFLDNQRQQLKFQISNLEKTVAALTAEIKELVEDYCKNIEPQVATLDERNTEIHKMVDALKRSHERLQSWASSQGRKAGQGSDDVAYTDDDNDEPSFGHKGKGVKIDQPEKYGGNKNGVNLDDWLEQVMLWLKYTGHTKDESKIMSTLLLLKGGAREYM